MTRKRSILAALWLVVGTAGQARADLDLVHNYTLNNTYNDSLGGPALANDGGTLDATGYTFGANQGLTLSSWTTGAATSANYGIEIKFSLSELSGWRKLIDFQDRSDDQGLYLLDGQLQFYNFATGAAVVAPDAAVDVLLTRDGSTGVVTGYLDGVQQFQFTDSGGVGIFSATNNLIRFFEDDNVTGQSEASGGKVTSIQIYALQAVPEPSAQLTAGVGALALLAYGWRRRASA